MQWTQIARNWTAFTPAILDRWPEAEENEILALPPSQDALAAYLSTRTGDTARDLLVQIKDWQMGEIPTDIAMDETRDMTNISQSASNLGDGEVPSDRDDLFGDDNQADRPIGRS